VIQAQFANGYIFSKVRLRFDQKEHRWANVPFWTQARSLCRMIQAFKRAVVLDPAYSVNHANLGALYRERGDHQRPIEELRITVGLAPQRANYYLNLGEAYEAENAWDDADKHTKKLWLLSRLGQVIVVGRKLRSAKVFLASGPNRSLPTIAKTT
jgi:hypothetical protein